MSIICSSRRFYGRKKNIHIVFCVPCVQQRNAECIATMRFVELVVLPHARVYPLLSIAMLYARSPVPATRGTSSVEIAVCPSHNAAASTKVATTASAKCFILMDSVRKNASAQKTER